MQAVRCATMRGWKLGGTPACRWAVEPTSSASINRQLKQERHSAQNAATQKTHRHAGRRQSGPEGTVSRKLWMR